MSRKEKSTKESTWKIGQMANRASTVQETWKKRAGEDPILLKDRGISVFFLYRVPCHHSGFFDRLSTVDGRSRRAISPEIFQIACTGWAFTSHHEQTCWDFGGTTGKKSR